MKRVFAVAALIALVACGDPSAARDNSPGARPISTVKPAATMPATADTTAQPATVPPTTVVLTTPVPTAGVPTTVPSTTVLPPTSVPQTTTVVPDPETSTAGLLAIDVLAFIIVENEHTGGYVRDLFDYPADLDGDGCDTRAEVLRVESITPAQVDVVGCTVVQGDWLSRYDGQTFSNPGELEIDHVVPLKEAWDSGAWRWNVLALVAYANDLSDARALSAVSTSTNRAKGDKDPSNWLPPAAADTCSYIGDWVAIKARWSLSMDQSEYGRIRNMLAGPCAGLRLAPLEPLQASTEPANSTPPTPPTDPANTAVYYANCTAARAAGAAPIHIGEPGYRPALDGDKDGIACE